MNFVHNAIMVNEWCKCCIMCCVYFMCSAFDGIYCSSYIHVCTLPLKRPPVLIATINID